MKQKKSGGVGEAALKNRDLEKEKGGREGRRKMVEVNRKERNDKGDPGKLGTDRWIRA